MKQHIAEASEVYKGLIRRYHTTLDLVSKTALANLDALVREGFDYAELLSPSLQPGYTLLDIGSGVGFPGIPLAIAFPEHAIHLVERRQRRASFLKIVVARTGLDNATVHASDVLDIEPVQRGFSVVTAQAVGSFSTLYCLSRHLHAPQVTLVSRKGDLWRDELDDLQTTIKVPPLSVRTKPLERHGTLVAVELPGGLPCPQSG